MISIKQTLLDIREDACELFGIHHTALSNGFGPSKRIIEAVDRVLLTLEKEEKEDGLKKENT